MFSILIRPFGVVACFLIAPFKGAARAMVAMATVFGRRHSELAQ
jgi:hypothetical protein